MARLEEETSNLEYLPEKFSVPRKAKRKIRPKAACCLIFFFFLLGSSAVGLAAIAKTGLVSIPFFSEIFYQLPQPDRIIEINGNDVADFQKGLNIQINPDSVTIKLTEKELTYLLRQTLASGSDPFFANTVQATISDQGVEIFGLLLKPVKTNLTIKVVPQLSAGKLVFTLADVKIGDFSAPPFLLDWLTASLLKDKLNELNQQLEKLGQIESLKLAEGFLEISGQLDLTILKN